MRFQKTGALIILLVVLAALGGACAPENDAGREVTADPTIPADTKPVTMQEETTSGERTITREGTLAAGEQDAVVLRLEGEADTQFSGICSVGGEQSVLSGRVPRQFDFDLGGEGISCRIQKQDDHGGSLRVILLTGDTTRSVQQTDAPGGTINISYGG